VGGHRRVTEGYSQVSVAYRGVVAGSGAAVAGGDGCRGQEAGEAADGVAGGDAGELGERREGGVPAGRAPGAGLALVPAEHVLSGFEGFLPQMLARYAASARGARARRSYDRIMDDTP
jgi:hypothetical protein